MNRRNLPLFITRLLTAVTLLASGLTLRAEPQLTSWFMANSGKYARIFPTAADEPTAVPLKAGTPVTTWSRGSGVQNSPAYADVNEINYSANWVYIRTTGLASHLMGPWYLDAAKSNLFPNYPSNTATVATNVYRIPRVPTAPASPKQNTGNGPIGRFVNGVSFFDNRDAFSYVTSSNTEVNPGDGIWNRDAYVNEKVTFDAALAHQAGNNYHYHVHPIALRYQLADHVDYNAQTNRYTESAAAPAHSPIIAWAADGYPIYGPYGYSDPTNASGGVRRMVSGFVPRDGTNGTTNLTTAGRHTLPAWAVTASHPANLDPSQYGPNVGASFPFGRYLEDNDHLGSLGFTQTTGSTIRDFDLDIYNGRTCVTPEFPTPTYVYFSTINSDGTPAFPYNIGRQFYGTPTGGAVTPATMNADTNPDTGVVPPKQHFIGGANRAIAINTPNVSGGIVTLTWSAVEGGTYSVDAAPSGSGPWTGKTTGIVTPATTNSATSGYAVPGASGSSGTEYGRVNRTALATYDTTGQTAATVAQTTTTSYPVTANTPPTITSISPVTVMKNNATSAIAFTVGDAETAVASLTVTATSSNTTLVPNANIVIGGSGASRTVTATPASGQVGTATITVTVNDGTTTTSTTFTITVQPPNILIIIADDFGLDASAVYNPSNNVAPTPNIASLASNGVRFNKAYTYTVCSPSRSSMLTGRYGFRTGTANVAGGGTSNNALKAAEFTLPDAFAANSGLNYQLKQIGKWHLGGGNTAPVLIGGWPLFSGYLAGEVADYYSWSKVVTDGITTTATTSTTYVTTDQVNDAVSFINTQTAAGKPWVTWVAFAAPHISGTGATPAYQKPPTGLLLPPYDALSGTTADIAANPLNYYNAAVQAMDTEIGRLLASVDLNKTDVIFVGDNGTPNSILQSPYPANKGKATLSEGGIRVPLIIRGPDVASPGRTTDVLTHFVDLYSTILDLAGINVATTTSGVTLDSQSLLPVLQNQSVTRNYVYGDYFDLGIPALTDGGRVIRNTQYKLVRLNTGTERFYDLSVDPYEATNLIAGGFASMTVPQQTGYNTLSTELATYNTAPTITSIANQSVTLNTATSALAFTIGDNEEVATNLAVSSASSNATLVPAANVVIGGTGASRTVTVTPASGQVGTTTITVSVTDGIFTTNSVFNVTVGSSTTVSGVILNPATPTNTDPVAVTATATPASGRTISGVSLQYNTGSQVTAPAFREAFTSTSTTTGLAGAQNTWTTTNVRAAADVKQRGGNANHVATLTAGATTNTSTTVTCASTTGLIPGIFIGGTGIPQGATISSITNGTTFVISSAATATNTGLTLTAGTMTLTACTLGASPTINTASTTGVAAGMGFASTTGTGLTVNPPNPTVAGTITATSFNSTGTVTAVPTSLYMGGSALSFTNGTVNLTDTMAESPAITASAPTAGSIDFYVRNADLINGGGWALQISPDGSAANYVTRMAESFALNGSSGCALNATTTVTVTPASDVSKFTVGSSIQGAPLTIAACTLTTGSATITTANTTGLAVGMFITGSAAAGIPANSRITAVAPGVSFTLNNTVTPPTSPTTQTLTANYLPGNATVSAINTGAGTLTLSTAAFYTGTVALSTVNHAFAPRHYDFVAGDLGANMKFRFQYSGYSTAVPPARVPEVNPDDIIVTLTTGSVPQTLTMFDDGAHGDGAAGDGVYGATIPAQTAGTTVSYTITATDSATVTATANGSYTVIAASPALAVTPATNFSSAGAAGSGSFSPSSITYTLTNSGTGSMTWTAAKTQSWLSLSATGGTLAAGANTTVTASINTANANALPAATYNDTITFTNSTNGSGSTPRAASLLISTGTPTAPAPPVLAPLPLFSAGTAKTITWPAVATATSYTLQIASSSNFTTNLLSSQTVGSPSATFTNLADGVSYFYRVIATNGIGSSAYSNIVSSTQDTGFPSVMITLPASGTSTATNTITVTGTASDTRSGISGVKVNNVAATSGDNFVTWSATVPLGFGTNAITATALDGAGNQTTSAAIRVTLTAAQTYNPLIIPDTITSTTLNLALNQTTKQFANLGTGATLGSATTTLGYNGALTWGPTLIMNQGDTVQLNVTNNLDQSSSTLLRETATTVHWHGFHIPAIMDGGPRQVIAGGTTWSPTFPVKNNAATYWYHPHLHIATQEQLTLGAGGFIIVRDPQEAALALPRTYGTDDIPLAITTRRFLSGSNEFSSNQYVQNDGSTSSLDNYGDVVLVNGTISPQVSLPRQYVRLRILNAEIQRGYNLGISDNRSFYVIANDQGLLNAPIAVTRMFLMPGERVEILVNLGGDTVGSSIDLKAYNTGQVFGFPGNEGPVGGSNPTGNAGPENASRVNNADFNLLHINVAAQTANPITALPSVLANNTYWTNTDVTNSRTIQITGGQPVAGNSTGFTFDSVGYTPSLFNYTIPLNAVEKWTITGGGVFGHSLHIHDIKFNVIARNTVNAQGAPTGNGLQVTNNQNNVSSSTLGLAALCESGWKDTVYVPKGESVTVIAKYDDFASPTNPYMLHCHMLNHEDGGLMGQFVVTNSAVEKLAIASFTRTGGSGLITMNFNTTPGTTYLLQYSPDMTTGSWVTLDSVTSNGTSVSYTDADVTRLSQARGFYRVVLPSVPALPVITSALAVGGTHGQAFSYQIAATNSPASFSATGLPAGLSINTNTGLISGTPAAAATTRAIIIASNAGGTDDQVLVLTVN